MNRILFISLLLFIFGSSFAQDEKSTYKKFDKSLKLIETQYADSVNTEALVIKAIEAMVKELDPHSKYLTAKSLAENNESLNGSFSGVGIQYQIIRDTLMVLSTVPDGPAYAVGLSPGDKIIAIDNDTLNGEKLNNTKVKDKLRGENGSKVILKVIKYEDKTIKNYELTRGPIPINTINTSYLINKNTGYMRIASFSRTTESEFQFAVMKLQLQGMQHLIIDLRGNPGGLMVAAINLADNFLEKGKLIVYTQGAHSPRTEYKANDNGTLEQGKLIILMDENSASASEILAGAIQDWDRGLIMGRRSYGKGLVGRNFTLTDGSALRLTTGRYYTPSNRCIQKTYDLGKSNVYNQDLKKRYESGELYSADSVHFNDSLKYYTAAKRLVYGGGGIMPDIFVPIDTMYNSTFFKQINQYGLLNYYAGLYFEKNLKQLRKKYPDFNAFNKSYEMTEDEWNSLSELAFSMHKIKGSAEDIAKSKDFIKLQFKAFLARDLFDDGDYHQVLNTLDTMVITAEKLIKTDKAFIANQVQH